MGYLRKVFAIVWKDIVAELRTKEMFSAMFVFAVLVIVMFNFAFELRVSGEQVRRVDRIAIEKLAVAGVVLMENAGRNAADVAEQMLGGSAAGKNVAVLAGAGNNGGDGFVIARHLINRGAKVATFLLAPPEKIGGDAEINLTILRNMGR